MKRKIFTTLIALLMITSLAAPLVGSVGAQQTGSDGSGAPSGMVGVPDEKVGPVGSSGGGPPAGAGPPGDVQLPDSVPTHAAAWNVHASEHAGDLSVSVGETSSGSPALVFSDDKNHAGREVSIDAKTLEETVGDRPEVAYGLHENGSEWTSSIRYESGSAVLEIPHFSSNTVTFEGEIQLTGSPSSDGQQYVYDLSDAESADNLAVNLTGVENRQWSNESGNDIDPSGTQSINPNGNMDPAGNSANGLPSVTASLPTEMVGSVTDSSNLGGTNSVDISGNYAFVVADGVDRLTVVDISDEKNPTVVGSVANSSIGRGIAVSGDYAYITTAGASNSLVTVDISTPSSPSVVDEMAPYPGYTPRGIEVGANGDYVYSADPYKDRLSIIDITNPSSPTHETYVEDSSLNNPWDVAVTSSYAFLSSEGADTVTAVDISSPSTPSVTDNLSDATKLESVRRVATDGSYVYASSRNGNRVTIINSSDKTDLTFSSSLTNVDGPYYLEIEGDYLYAGLQGDSYGFTVIDVTDRTTPETLDSIGFSNKPGGIGLSSGYAFIGVDNSLKSITKYETVSSLDVSSDGSNAASATVGSLETGQSTTVELGLAVDATALDWSATSGAPIDTTVQMEERTVTEDPTVEINGDSYSYTGMLSDGSTTTLDASSTSLESGKNTVNITVSENYAGPTGQVGLDYNHDAVEKQSVAYDSEAYSERYNVSKKFADDQSSATLTIPFTSTVMSVRTLETRTNGGDWSMVADSDYSLKGTELTVQLGDVSAGDEVEVRAIGSKVQVSNGEISVTDATALGEDLSTKIQIETHSEDFAIDVNATEYNEDLHYTYSESWTNAQSFASVSSDGSQELRLPEAGAGESARIGTIPLEVDPADGQYDIRVSSAGAEPELQVRDSTTASQADLVWKDTTSGNSYQLYSLTADGEIERGTAQSPVTFTHGGTSELLVIYDLGAGGGGGGGGGGPTTTGSPTDVVPLLIASVAGIAVLFLVIRRIGGDDSLSGVAVFGAGALIIGALAIQALAPRVLAQSIGAALENSFPLILIMLGAVAFLYFRSRQDNVTLKLGGRDK